MALSWFFDKTGGFVVEDPARRWASYAYKSSPHATAAKKKPEATAKAMAKSMESDLRLAQTTPAVRESMDRLLSRASLSNPFPAAPAKPPITRQWKPVLIRTNAAGQVQIAPQATVRVKAKAVQGRRKTNPENEQRELRLFIENESTLHRALQLAKQRAASAPSISTAVDVMKPMVQRGARTYIQMHGAPGDSVASVFSATDIHAVARFFVNDVR
jgi:hypothetical protein